MAVTWKKLAYASDLHAAVTLAASAEVLLGLSTQELSLDAQDANKVLAGPSSGAAAAPTFRALVVNDLPFMKARMYRNAAQSLTFAQINVIGVDTDSFDTHNITNTSTNRITPGVAGYYYVSGQVSGQWSNAGYTIIILDILKNGTSVGRGIRFQKTVIANEYVNVNVSDLVYLDADDYVQVGCYVDNDGAGTFALEAGNSIVNYLSLVGPF